MQRVDSKETSNCRSTNYKQGRWKKSVKDAKKKKKKQKPLHNIMQNSCGKGKSVAIGKNPE